MDLVPAMRKSDKEVGMYNLVNDTFFTNAGTGQFGYKIKDFPNGYTQLAYIESNGNPYINTGITYAADREITCDFLYSKFIAYVAIFSNYVDEGSNIIRCILGASSGSIFPQFNSKASATSAVSCAISKNHSITMKTGNAILDGTSRSISTTQGTENNTSIVLFRSKVGGNAYDIGARIYSFVVRDSGTKVMELVPAKRNSDNEVGMYDLVSGSFLTNIGTGTFGYGEL